MNRNILKAYFTIALLLSMFVAPAPASAQQTVAADSLVETMGVNVHLHYDHTPYMDQFPLLRTRVIELGVRHVRDGLINTQWQGYFDRHKSLAAAGIKGNFIIAHDESVQVMAEYPARMGEAFESYEAPNEMNLMYGRADWLQVLRGSLERLKQLDRIPSVANYPVIGPSLTTEDAFRQLGDVGAGIDYVNMHNYYSGRNPGTSGWGDDGYGSIAWNMRTSRISGPGKPVITTETGYQDHTSQFDNVPAWVATRYMPRVAIEQFRAGVTRTFIYELFDFNNNGHYGLLNADGTPKGSFTALKNLLNLLSDRGPAFTVTPLQYSVQGGNGDLRHMVFQRRDGTYFMAIWLETLAFNMNTRQAINVPTQSVTVNLGSAKRIARSYRWQADGSVQTTTHMTNVTSMPVTVSDSMTLIELTAPLAPSTGSSVVPSLPNLPVLPNLPLPTIPVLPTTGAPASARPGAPATFAATPNGSSVLLRWNHPVDGGVPSAYRIEAATNPAFSSPVATQVAGSVTELWIPDLAAGTYHLRVKGVNALGDGEASPAAVVTIAGAGAPTLSIAQTQANPIVLSWTAGDGPAPAQYVLSAGTAPGASDLVSVPMGPTQTQLTATAPVGMRLYVRVAAVNASGSVRSNEISFVVGGGASAPAAPTMNAAQVSGSRVSLSWQAGAGSTPQNYVLAVGTASGASNLGTFPMGTATSIAADAPAGQLYARVIAQNAGGTATSNEIVFTVGGAAAPLASPVMNAPAVSGTSVQMTWNAVAGAQSYMVVARASANGPVIATLPVNGTSITVPGVPAGTYFVSVVARAGNATSPESAARSLSVR